MHIASDAPDITRHTVYMGGPVQTERGFVLHQPAGRRDNTLRISDRLGLATSKEILEDIARGAGPDEIFVALGCAGWGAGQLEQEMADNAWLSGPADIHIGGGARGGRGGGAAAAAGGGGGRRRAGRGGRAGAAARGG